MNKSSVLDQLVLGYAPLVGRWHDWSGLRIRLMPSGRPQAPDAPGLLAALVEAWSARSAAEGSAGAAPSPVLIDVVDLDWAQHMLSLWPPRWVGLALPATAAQSLQVLDRLRECHAGGAWLAARANGTLREGGAGDDV